MNVYSILQDAARQRPDATAVVHQRRRLRYSELYSAAESLARILDRAGVQAGDKVGLMCANSPEYIFALFAVLRLGGIVVSIPPELKAAEVAALTAEAAADAYCYGAQFKSRFAESEKAASSEKFALAGASPLVVQLAPNRRTPADERERLRTMNIASIRFSSGTTSSAKGILVSHATLIERMAPHFEAPPITAEDSVLWLQSMARGLPSYIAAYLVRGVKIVIADPMQPDGIPRLLLEEKVTVVEAARLFYQMMVNQETVTANDLAGVRYLISTGAAVPDSVAAACHDRFGREIVEHYGLAECGKVLANLSEDSRKRGSVGKPVVGREVRLGLPGRDSSEAVSMGEILVRGPGMFDAYYKPWQLREDVLEDGWLRTGDIARRDADGYYWIVGRVKDVINVGGVKVFPSELEEMLLSHPAVEEAVVYGVAEDRFGEVPHAKVKLKAGATATEREIMRYVNEKVSVFKSLRSVEFVDEIPKTVTGKPKRSA